MLSKILRKVQYCVTNDKLAAQWKAQGIPLKSDDYGWSGELDGLEGNEAYYFVLDHRAEWACREDNFDEELHEISFYTTHTSITITVADPPAYPEPLEIWTEGMSLTPRWFYGDYDNVSAFFSRIIEDQPLEDALPIKKKVEKVIAKLPHEGQLYEFQSPFPIFPSISAGTPIYKLAGDDPTDADYGVPVKFAGGFTLYQELDISYGEVLNLMILHC